MNPPAAQRTSTPGEWANALLPLQLATKPEVTLTVSGWSMGSLLGPEARVQARALQGTPPLGAVVLIRGKGRLVAHRVIGRDIRRGLVVTKGDACRHADPPVPMGDVLGRLTGIVEAAGVRVPSRIRFPLALWVAINSRCQDRFWRTFPGARRRWDVCGLCFKLMQRIESWMR